MSASGEHIDYQALYQASELRNNQLAEQVQQLQHQLHQIAKMLGGFHQERFTPASANPSQLALEITPAAAPASSSLVQAKKITYVKTSTASDTSTHPGRAKFSELLRREEVVLEPAEDVRHCKKIGEDITEVLEWKPGELYVKRYIRYKYVCPVAEDTSATRIVIAPLPVRALDKSIAGEGLLAQIIIDKFVDHLPLNRQLERFKRSGVTIAESTVAGLLRGVCELIKPLGDALLAETVQAGYLHADETGIRVLDKSKQGTTHKGFFWVYEDSINKLVYFDYQPGRGRAGPESILKDFKGYLQTDGYDVYDSFDKEPGITQLHCMAHARRKFHDALDNDKECAEYVLTEMQKLYAIEAVSKEAELSFEQRREKRQREAVPVLKDLGEWMKLRYMNRLPKGAIAEALAYSIKRWGTLSLYTTDGRLQIDNNAVERSIRPVAIGRKNYLFCGSHEAAKRAAMLYSLLGTCKLHGVNPYDWLKDVLTRIPTHHINKIQELLPHRWQPLQESLNKNI